MIGRKSLANGKGLERLNVRIGRNKLAAAEQAKRHLIRKLVMRLDGGQRDPKAALALMQLFRNHGSSRPLPPDMYEWLYGAFGSVIDGMDADKALGSKKGKGERKHFAIDELAIACCVELDRRKGLSRADSIDAAATFYSKGERTIENAVRAVTLHPALPDEILLQLKLGASNRKA
jgi:hypothetical protein